ncbi:CcmD family protein [bacterium]|nr:MAG: CcmD family protein [bacterium]
MSNVFYVVTAYTIIWIAILVYMIRLGDMRRKLEARLARVEGQIQERGQDQ